MIRIIIGVVLASFIVVSTIVVLYWRDMNHDPSALDLLLHFAALPVFIALLVLAPYLIYKWQQHRKQQRDNPESSQQVMQDSESEPAAAVEWIKLHVFSSSAWSVVGENEQIPEGIIAYQSPELDPRLLNGYGLPILSYRIKELDEMLETEEEDYSSPRQRRIQQMMLQQMQQHSDVLWQISEHLKKSAMFYEGQSAQEYRMHPAWIDPHAEYQADEDMQPQIQHVSRLNKLKIHVVLTEELLHLWDQTETEQLLADYLAELGLVPQMFHVEHYYWGAETAYKNWLDLLKDIEKEQFTVSYILVVDSEIDQDTIDEKIWISEQYIPSEYVASCCLAAPSVQVDQLDTVKTIKIAQNEKQLNNSLRQFDFASDQFTQEQPFVIQLDDLTNIKVVKHLDQQFSATQIEPHHYLYTKPSVGQTEHLAKIYGFLLGLQLPEQLTVLVYQMDHPQVHSFIQPYQPEQTQEPV